MLRNLTISPELDKEDWDPDVITRMIIIAPGAHVSESEIVNELHMLDLPPYNKKYLLWFYGKWKNKGCF